MFVKLEKVFGSLNESALNESVRTPSDAAKAISKFFKVAIKPTGTPDVFEVSGRDRTKLNNIKEGEIIDGNLMIDSIEDDHYAISFEIRKSGASRGVKVRFTDEPEMFESVDRTAQDAVKAIAKGLGINAKLTDKYYHEYLLAEIKVGDRVKLAKANKEGTKEFDGYKLTVLSGNKLDLEYAIITSPKGTVKVAFGDAQSIDNAVTFAMNESVEAVELNEVTGFPKHKTSVPVHML